VSAVHPTFPLVLVLLNQSLLLGLPDPDLGTWNLDPR
jgi:hypothetical protein